MFKNDFFKVGLLISAATHFFLIVLFPLWKPVLPPPEPRKIYEVSLINVKPIKLKVKKVPGSPPKPKIAKAEKKVTPKLSPVEVAVKSTQNVPVLPPRARVESKLRVPLPNLSFKPVASHKAKEVIPRRERQLKKTSQESPAFTELPFKISSPIQGEVPSIKPSPTGEGGENTVSGVKGPVGITFRGLGSRRPERTPQPSYPPEMEKRGVEGQGEVKIYVAPTGQVLDVEIIRTSGWHSFDEEVRSALLKWRFTPVDEAGIKTYEGNFYFRFAK